MSELTSNELATYIMSDCGCSTNNERLLERIVERLDTWKSKIYTKGREAEREACAKVCEDMLLDTGYQYAAEIRARSNT